MCLFWFSHKPNALLFINKIKNICSTSITCFASYFSKTAPKVIKAITTGLGIVFNFIKRVVFSLFIAAIFLTIFFFWVTYPNWVHNVFNNFSEFSNSKSFNSIFELYCHYYEEIPSWIRDIVNFIPDTQSYLNSDSKVEDKSFSNFGTNFGTFGDSFGALNTLFSGFAFAGIIISIFLQSKELTETRKEIKAQKEEFEKQTAVFNKQTFENTFFQMLQQHNELIKSITNESNGETLNGRAAIEKYCDSLEKIVNINKLGGISHLEMIKLSKPTQKERNVIVSEIEEYKAKYADEDEDEDEDVEKNDACSIYTNFHNYDAPQLRIYFMSIYQILKYVRDKEEAKEIKNGKFYTNILRAQLLNSELKLLFFNCLSEKLGAKKFRPLVERYAFFEHLSPRSNNLITENLVLSYNKEAFGTNEHYTGIHKSHNKRQPQKAG